MKRKLGLGAALLLLAGCSPTNYPVSKPIEGRFQIKDQLYWGTGGLSAICDTANGNLLYLASGDTGKALGLVVGGCHK